MERDSRERERGGARSDVASLWIDFLLLPEKLEEHLVAGPAAIPSPIDLISMFLEQALVSHKSSLVNNSSANGAVKDTEPQGAVKSISKTASLLCEKAARVAVVKNYTLSEIESSIPSPLHQFILLKALIRHDKSRSLLHQCNLHRWLIHKALQSHPIGSASPNVVLPVNRLGSWVTGDDLGEVFHGFFTGHGDAPSLSSTGDNRVEEEHPSVEFLEKILQEEELALRHEDTANSFTGSIPQKGMANGRTNREQSLSTAYKCQVILDVAEVHFMRGRIRKANELFVQCGEMLAFLSTGVPPSAVSNGVRRAMSPELSPVPQDRLAGFVIACQMLLGTSANGHVVEAKCTAKFGDMADSCCFGAPSPTQWAVIACERNRLAARRFGSSMPSRSELANVASRGAEISPSKDNVEVEVSGRTSSDTMGRAFEDDSTHHPSSRRSRKRTYLEEANGELKHEEYQLEKEEIIGSESVREVNAFGPEEAELHEMRPDEISLLTRKEDSVDHLLNGVQVRLPEKDGFGKETRPWEWKIVDVKDGKNAVQSLGDVVSRIDVDIVKKKQATSVRADGYCPEVQLFVDLNGSSAEDSSHQMVNDVDQPPTSKPEKSLIQAFVDDILRGHLSWSYCLSVEKDPMLSKLVRSKLAACNAVRSVLEGEPVESFLRTIDHFEDNKDAVEFLMQLLLAIKGMQARNKLSTNKSCGVDSGQNGRLLKLGFSKQKLAGQVDTDASVVSHRVRDLAMYACCVIDKPWCWASAERHGLVGQNDLPRLPGRGPYDTCKTVDCSSQLEKIQSSYLPKVSDGEFFAEDEILLGFVEAESIHEIEALVGKVHKMAGRGGELAEPSIKVKESLSKETHLKNCFTAPGPCEHCQSPVQFDMVKPIGNGTQYRSDPLLASRDHHSPGNLSPRDMCIKCQNSPGQRRAKSSVLDNDVAAILRRRAFSAFETLKNGFVARRLYELALTLQPKDFDSAMMLWLLDSTELVGQDFSQKRRELPRKCEGGALTSLHLLDFVVLQLIERELWDNLCELYKWAISFLEPVRRDSNQSIKPEKDLVVRPIGGGGPSDSAAIPNTGGWQLGQKQLLQTLSIARILVEMIPRCITLQKAASQNHFNEDVAHLSSTLPQLFEEFMCVLVGVESDGLGQGTDGSPQWRGTQLGMGPPPPLSSSGVPLIFKVSNPRVLMALASLTAGWLQRCHRVGLAQPWVLVVERYGVLAGVTAEASLPPPAGSLPYAGSVLRLLPPRVPPEFGRDLFGVLLEGIVGLPGVVEGDREKGHQWLQGLADLAFEDEAHVKALRLYLQAGSIRSAQYCDRASSMNDDIFTPWVIQRMVTACRTIGAGVQAAVLCQCLPVPDHQQAFAILQENILIMDRDAAAYFECLWEVPILELLVHMHSRAGDEARVSSLIGLLQQPALNVHNPDKIRQAHIRTMKQRFLKRLAAELM